MSKDKTPEKRTAENIRAKEKQVNFRMSDLLYKQVESFCKSHNLKPSEGLRLLIERGLGAK